MTSTPITLDARVRSLHWSDPTRYVTVESFTDTQFVGRQSWDGRVHVFGRDGDWVTWEEGK